MDRFTNFATLCKNYRKRVNLKLKIPNKIGHYTFDKLNINKNGNSNQ